MHHKSKQKAWDDGVAPDVNFRLESTEMSWQDGANLCAGEGAFLASILSLTEELWLYGTFDLANLGKHVNIGFTDAAQEGMDIINYSIQTQ